MEENPELYKSQKFFRKNNDVEDIYKHWDALVSEDELHVLTDIVHEIAASPPTSARELEAALLAQRKKRHVSFRKAQLLYVYNSLISRGELTERPLLQRLLVKKSSKSQSGVLVITVLTSPYPRFGNQVQRFSCAWNCYYCPSEPDQPKSYLHDEPAVKRANENGFDPVLQLTDRAATLAMNGHPVDKIELLVLGGTWASYPHQYQEEFCRDLFYAANTFWEREKRPRLSLAEEQGINERARCKIIGLTLETRPDTIDTDELRRLRSYGCTRVQLGLQHTDDAVLKKINRGCTTQHAITALRRLKDACYKVDVHLMPNLPGSSMALDQAMFERMLSDADLQADQWKIYPTQVVPWTVIKKWFERGEYVPYRMDDMFELLMKVKARVHPWIRLNRVVRDIPIQYVSGGLGVPNLREDLLGEMSNRGLACRCIRCREVGGNASLAGEPLLVVHSYAASGGSEFFISFESDTLEVLLGFVRLRLPGTFEPRGDGAQSVLQSERPPFPELEGCMLIRELHVYGQLIATDDKSSADTQHTGLGRRLMAEAERIGRAHGFRRAAVIAGIGTRGYYRKLGYELGGVGGFMLKELRFFSLGWASDVAPLLRAGLFACALALLGVVGVVAAQSPYATLSSTTLIDMVGSAGGLLFLLVSLMGGAVLKSTPFT
eukprot:CAMPEP_0119361664 /NCGR_PEP_ID=MMETSP1334-20130426/8920_1 /TAXON_ID=127549 /ORGANISM="Calcidiscus leptoporus, Strain RCC1130" /LENGTH=662 /DNA_ID=CAMNT_0007376737 /DNA_START=32 /DNA_END=2020 /DNA_ORIENTATION=+